MKSTICGHGRGERWWKVETVGTVRNENDRKPKFCTVTVKVTRRKNVRSTVCSLNLSNLTFDKLMAIFVLVRTEATRLSLFFVSRFLLKWIYPDSHTLLNLFLQKTSENVLNTFLRWILSIALRCIIQFQKPSL